MSEDQQQSGKIARRRLWIGVSLAFLILIAAWSVLITLAVKHAPETIEVPKIKRT